MTKRSVVGAGVLERERNDGFVLLAERSRLGERSRRRATDSLNCRMTRMDRIAPIPIRVIRVIHVIRVIRQFSSTWPWRLVANAETGKHVKTRSNGTKR